MAMEKNKTEIRFKKLPLLISDMKKKEWIIESFPFKYKEVEYIVILTLFKLNEIKPNNFAIAKVEFILSSNIKQSIMAYVDFYNVHFYSTKDFCYFFGVELKNINRDIFNYFSEVFAPFIPKEKLLIKSNVERRLIGSRVEGNNPNAIYCYDVRRNGTNKDGSPNKRSIENSNKARILRPYLYEHYFKDSNLSFFFSDKQEDERTDPVIMKIFSKR
ncbi:hypothetical protein J5Y03_14650 [Bacillus sp. RG28]|uniref:Uncharacterized protein n=1 Tax=Gottfriedia endophytica TaxID=2820819 RepID=A0A940NJD4_9BACI|nr:DUF6037 family protein [Gottfriedia endophytica]MBP0726399.1 hypothetical protein [Gottfriedia endophytica]